MQKQAQSQILQSSRQCTEISCKIDGTGHKSAHQTVSCSVLRELLKQYIEYQQCPRMQKFAQDFTKVLTQMKTSIDKVIISLQQQIIRTKIQVAFDIKQQQLIEKCLQFIQASPAELQKSVQKLLCCDVHKLHQSVCNFEENKKEDSNILAARLDHFGDKVGTGINDHIKEINKAISKYKQQNVSTVVGKSSGNVSSEKKEKKQEDNDFELRPTRSNQSQTKLQTSAPNKARDRCLKIQQLAAVNPGNGRFDIKLKVITIVKNFRIQNTQKMELRVGDETGTAICVVTANKLVKPGCTLLITDCFIYNFHGHLKQIQSNKNSLFKQVQDIKSIGKFELSVNNKKGQNFDHNDGRNNDKEQRRNFGREDRRNLDKQDRYERRVQDEIIRTPRRVAQQQQQKPKVRKGMIKVKDIEPDSQNISMIVQVYKILSTDNRIIDCYIGDETGVVRAEFPESLAFIKQGSSLNLTRVDAKVVQEHIRVRMNRQSKVQNINATFAIIKYTIDMSAQQWVEEGSEKQQDEEQLRPSKMEDKVSVYDQ